MQKKGIRQRDIQRVKKLLADGKSPAEVAEMYRCPVKTIESFFQTPKPKTKAKVDKADEGEAAEA